MRKTKIALAGLALAALLTTATTLPAQEQDVPKPVYKAPNGKVFPAHWGEPPRIQTRDLRPLPGGYGRGSGTLARWIQGHLNRDAANKPKPGKPKKPIGKKVPTYAEWLKGGKKIPPGMAFPGGTPWFDESKGQRRSPEAVYQMLYGRFRPKPGGPIGRPVQPVEIDPQQVIRLRQEIDKLNAAIKKKEDYLARADLTVEAEQKEQAQLNQMRQRLALMQQLIKAPAGKPVPARGGRKPFPKHWGAPPRIQTRDLRPLPGGYGRGSSTLARWIQKNLDNDAKNKEPQKPTPPPVPQVPPPPVGLVPVPAPASPVPPVAGGAKINAEDVAKVKAALQAWRKAKQDCGGNYEYTVGFTSAFGFGHTTTIVVANNKVVERRYEEFNRQAPPPPGAKPNGFVEKGDGIGTNKKGAPARTLDELYQDAVAIASKPLPKHLRRYIRTNQSGLLLSCFTVDTRIADDAPTQGVRIGQIKLRVKQQKGGPSQGNNKQTQTEQIQKLCQEITAIQQFMARARLTKPAYERYNNQLKQLQARLKQLEDEASVKAGRQPVSKEFAARHPRGSYVPGRLLVGMEKGRTQEQCQQMLAGAIPGLKVTNAMFNNSILVVELPATLNEEQAITALKKVAGVEYAELDGVVSIQNNAGHGIQVQPLPRIKP